MMDKDIIKAIFWTNEEGNYEDAELNLSHHENFADTVRSLGYEQYLHFGNRTGFFIELYRQTEVPNAFQFKNTDLKKLPKFLIAQHDPLNYEVIICKNILELNQYLNSVIPIIEFDYWQKNKVNKFYRFFKKMHWIN